MTEPNNTVETVDPTKPVYREQSYENKLAMMTDSQLRGELKRELKRKVAAHSLLGVAFAEALLITFDNTQPRGRISNTLRG